MTVMAARVGMGLARELTGILLALTSCPTLYFIDIVTIPVVDEQPVSNWCDAYSVRRAYRG